MNTTRQTHRLRQTWEAEDHATAAQQSAQAAQQYYRLVGQKVNLMQAEIDSLRLEVQTAKKEIVRVEGNSNEVRNAAIVAGAASALITAFMINLVTAPQVPQRPQMNRYQIGGN